MPREGQTIKQGHQQYDDWMPKTSLKRRQSLDTKCKGNIE